MGLRSLYFFLSNMLEKFAYLKYSVFAILLFVSLKLISSQYFEIPEWFSLAFIGLSLGVGFLIAYAINLVVAQRLIRKLCEACKEVDSQQTEKLLVAIGFTEEETQSLTLYRPGSNTNCKKCGGIGYKGRRAITETLAFSPEIRGLIVEARENIDEAAILKQAKKEGMFTLQDSAREYVRRGETSIEELVRVVAT
jgi:type II secretory ATPase GspE/PulE/Tfp pilus assembly ATPase PilB-like protein